MKKLKPYLLNLRINNLQVIIALAMMTIGGSLWYDRHYFFWPPNLQSTLNDWRIDIFILLVGIMLLVSTALRPDDTVLIRTLLVLCGGIVLGLAFLQLGHIIFTSEFRMGHTVIGDVVLFLLILHVAHDHQEVDRLHIDLIIGALGTFLGVLITAYNAYHKNKRDTFQEIVTELKSERDDYKKQVKHLQIENDKLREELRK